MKYTLVAVPNDKMDVLKEFMSNLKINFTVFKEDFPKKQDDSEDEKFEEIMGFAGLLTGDFTDLDANQSFILRPTLFSRVMPKYFSS
ncbi:hypothetical protein [Campylobacter corcagiensis]|uniref:Uncharacterized protein n=1 Tax=Campylobacter corcagiensis TaxID=1448857 RepID=A0A7M1LDN5_9BACT|nr:hypothetical protein [Campylobacter corcagiensis]QKF65215.1 hypothetical protein CCORG_1372 [Campylobacter corcagiensis]QOQ86648.1 hypothetical protein IMC76_05305 [Campylobacter corcagiensis]